MIYLFTSGYEKTMWRFFLSPCACYFFHEFKVKRYSSCKFIFLSFLDQDENTFIQYLTYRGQVRLQKAILKDFFAQLYYTVHSIFFLNCILHWFQLNQFNSAYNVVYILKTVWLQRLIPWPQSWLKVIKMCNIEFLIILYDNGMYLRA